MISVLYAAYREGRYTTTGTSIIALSTVEWSTVSPRLDQKALHAMGIPVEIGNERTLDRESKVSGQHRIFQGEELHHGTLLYDADLYIWNVRSVPKIEFDREGDAWWLVRV